jgi:hypothetical protein
MFVTCYESVQVRGPVWFYIKNVLFTVPYADDVNLLADNIDIIKKT